MNTSRRLFIANTSGGALALALAACGGGGDGGYSPAPPPPSPPPPPPGALSCGATAISDNHGHVLTILAADLDSTVNMTYSIAGAAGHNHMVTLTPADFAQIKLKTAVTVRSTIGDGHTHDVTVNCA